MNITTSISPHKWRHTFATRFRSQGGNLEVLYALLGHQNLRMTQKYLHLNQKLMHPEYHRVMNQQPSKNQTLE